MRKTLPFPTERPVDYVKYSGEPKFSAARHLELGQPEKVITLDKLGYTDEKIQHWRKPLRILLSRRRLPIYLYT